MKTLFLIYLISAFNSTPEHPQPDIDFYALGKAKIDAGNWQMGLRFWGQGLQVQEERDRVDPRLALSATALVTEKQARALYKEATYWYLLTWRCYIPNEFDEVYENELDRLYMIMPEEKANNIHKKYKNKDLSFTEDILEFWLDSDPVVSTVENERLMEHWERIHYAQKQYRREPKAPYDTDGRGDVYIRYGKPDKTRLINTHVAGFRDPWTREYKEFDLGGLTAISIEMWRYTIRNGKESMVWYFGENSDEGKRYGAYSNVIDLIPTKNVEITLRQNDLTEFNDTTGARTPTEITKVSRRFIREMVRLAGVEQLAMMEPEVGPVYEEMVNTIKAWGPAGLENPNNFVASMRTFQNIHASNLYQRNYYLPKEMSKRFPPDERLQNNYKIFRFLDNDESTSYVLSFYSDLAAALKREYDFTYRIKAIDPDLYIKTAVIEYDQKYRMQQETPRIFKLAEQQKDDDLTLVLNSKTIGKRLFLSRDLLNLNRLISYPDSAEGEERYRRTVVATTGNFSPEIPEVLSANSFALSDIILSQEVEMTSDLRIPFSPSYTNVFKNGSDLLIYGEVYNLPSTNYALEVYIAGKRRLFGRQTFKDKGRVNLNVMAQRNRDEQLLKFELNDYPVGSYELVFEIKSAGKTVKKVVPFYIEE